MNRSENNIKPIKCYMLVAGAYQHLIGYFYIWSMNFHRRGTSTCGFLRPYRLARLQKRNGTGARSLQK